MSGGIPTPSEIPASQVVDGFQIPAVFSPDCFRSAVQYKPRDDDVFVATYPKCGTTWTQNVAMLIFRQGEPILRAPEFFASTPFLEITGSEAVETMRRPGAIKTHLPFHLAPWSDKAKYIYVARNPKDCCVSYYHHMKNIPDHGFNGTFDQFYEIFLSGKIDFGDYFDHLLGWYEHRNDPNVLFITYEEMKENPEASVLKLASFLGEEKYAKPLRDDPEKLKNVLEFSSFSKMKEVFNKGMEDMMAMSVEEILASELPERMKKMMTAGPPPPPKESTGEKPSVNFIRKGITGDWKNHFNEDQAKRMDQKSSERFKGTDLLNIWKNYM